MKAIFLLHMGALLGFLFQLGLLHGQRRPTPEGRSYGVFILNIGIWVVLDMMLFLPVSHGLEVQIVKAQGVFWIPVALWIMLFVYRLIKRPLDLLFYACAVAVGCDPE